MLEAYKSVRQAGAKVIIIKKSKFIGYSKPVQTEEEAVSFIDEIKKTHWNATHNCSAYMIGERDEIQKQSDDGEPSGTAGKPILEVIKAQGLKNVAIVVTRYFGGIMLGAGGLIRAYTDGAVAAIEAGEVVNYCLHKEIFAELDYTWLGKMENELRNRGTKTGETQFADKVTLLCLPKNKEAESFKSWLIDVTQGQVVLTEGVKLYFEV